MTISPDFPAFSATYEAGKPQLVWTKLVADLETPVSAYIKLADGRANSFLLESVEGGSVRGRYSMIGFKPDVIWRCVKGQAEINRNARTDAHTFEKLPGRPLETLRVLIRECQMDLPAGLPPMASGLFGFLGYDMVRDMERLPDKNPDPIGLPDAIMVRPTIVCIFDRLEDQVTLVTPVWPQAGTSARAAYEAALDYAQIRVQGGRPIVQHQAIGTKLAESAIRLETCRTMVWKAAWAADQGYCPHTPTCAEPGPWQLSQPWVAAGVRSLNASACFVPL